MIWGSLGFRAQLAHPWLTCLLCLALAWSGLGLSCMHCLGLVQQQQPAAFGGRRPRRHCCCCWTRPRQGRQDRPRPDQAKARHNKQASQAKSSISGFCIGGLPHRGHVFAPQIRFLGFVFGVCPLGAMFSPQKSDCRDLYSGCPPWGPCVRPKF